MRELQVQSRMISNVYFSQEDGKLRIVMKNGQERLFDGVPTQEALGLVSADSPGQYYIDNIRTQFRRVAAA